MNLFKPQKDHLLSSQTILPSRLSTALKEASYLQQGNDLVIKLHGDTWVIRDYFLHPVELQLQTGQKLSVQEVMNWTHTTSMLTNNGEVMNAQMKQSIGTVINLVKGPATAQGEQGTTRPLNQGDPIYLHDTVITTAQNYIKLKFNDGTILELGPLSRAQLDKYAYEHGGEEGKFQASIFSGIFHYISGKISGHHHGEHSKIVTPSANIGIRGSEIQAQIGTDGSTTILHLDGVISVTSRYVAQIEEVAYERGMTIYIPAEALNPSISRMTEEKIGAYQHQYWQPLGSATVVGMAEEIIVQDNLAKPSHVSSSSDEIVHFVPAPPEGRLPFPPMTGERYGDRPDQLVPRGEIRNEFPERMDRPAFPGEKENRPGPDFLDKPPMGENFLGRGSQREHSPEDYGGVPKREGPNQSTIEGTLKPGPISPEAFLQKIQIKEDEIREDIVDPRGKIERVDIQPSRGQVEVKEGQLIYTPEKDFYGEDRIIYILEDGRFGTLDIIIEPVNDPPSFLKEGDIKVDEDQTVLIRLEELIQDKVIVDIEGDPIKITRVEPVVSALAMDAGPVQLPHGTVQLNEYGDIHFIPEANFNGQEEFAFVVQDSQGASSVGKIVVTLHAINDPPVPENDSIKLDEFPISINELMANDKDVDGDSISFIRVLNSVHGQSNFRPEDGTVTFTPSLSNFTQGGVDYVISDGKEESVGHVSVIVENPQTEGPERSAIPLVFSDLAQDDNLTVFQEKASFSFLPSQLLKNDFDAEHLTIVEVKEGIHGQVVDDHQGHILFTPDAQFIETGVGRFIYQVTDREGHTDFALAIIQLNTPPQAHNDSFVTSEQHTPFIRTPSALLDNDRDREGDSLFISSVTSGLNGTVSLDIQGNIVFSPSDEFIKAGFGTFTYQISDGNQESHPALVSIQSLGSSLVVARDDVFFTPEQHTPFIQTPSALLDNDSGPEGRSPLFITSVTSGLNGTVSLDIQGNIVFSPSDEFIKAGFGTFTYQISDGNQESHPALVTINFQQSSLPIAHPDAKDIHSKTPFPISISQLLENDIPQGRISFSQVYDNHNGNISVQGENVEFTPNDRFLTEQKGTFTYEIKDELGNTAHAEVTLNLINNLPLATDMQPVDIKNGMFLTLDDLRGPLSLSDPDGDTLSITGVSSLENGGVSLQNGVIRFQSITPDMTQDTVRLLVRIEDGYGGSVQPSVIVHRNIPPIAIHDEEKTDKNQPISISVLENDFDANLGDTREINQFSQPPFGGTVTSTGDKFSFEPAKDFTGIVTWNYNIKDSSGTISNDTTVTVVVNDIIHPVARDDHLSQDAIDPKWAFQDQSLIIPNAMLLKNDSDKGLPRNDLKITNLTPGQGTENVFLVSDQLEFKPSLNFTGEANFSYTVTDQSGASSDPAQVTITVLPLLKATDDQHLPIPIDKTFTFSAQELWGNDIPSRPTDALHVIEVNQPEHGTVTINTQGDIEFTPTPNFSGPASFQYTVQDDWGHTDQATVNFEVVRGISPVITLPTAPLAYLGEPIYIASGATVKDPDSPDFDQGTLTVRIVDPLPTETLEIQQIPTTRTIDVSAEGRVTSDGVLIGTLVESTSGQILINLNDQSNEENVTNILQLITYHNNSSLEGPRTVEFVLTDGDGGTSQTMSREISIEGSVAEILDDTLSVAFNTDVRIRSEELLKNDKPAHQNDVLQIDTVSSSDDAIKISFSSDTIHLFVDGFVNDFEPVIFSYNVSGNGGGQIGKGHVTVQPNNVVKGTAGDDMLSSRTEQMEIILGEGGNDTLTSNGGGDVLLAGEGDDRFLFNPDINGKLTFKGGEGYDTLRFEGVSNRLLNITSENLNIQEIERIDLSGNNIQLQLTPQDVLDWSSQHQLKIEGNSSNLVNSIGQGWKLTPELQGLYYLYTAENSGAELLVHKDISQLIS